MPIVYLQPGDLSALQAQRVLDFLNRATSAAQLGRDIEFPNEPDIGVRLGQRLLDARAALGGSYTDIAQVRAVRLIGPERFTEICVAALGLDTQRWVELFYGGAPLEPQMETGLAVTLDVLPQPAWLGQPLTLVVRVRDHGGSARVGVPVTVQTGVGRLVYMFGFNRTEGQAVTVLTGADGSARLDLLTPPPEPLSEIQQAALEVALAKLDAAAPDPMKLEIAFRGIAADYLLERSYNLRRAIDIYVRERRDAMLDSLNPGRWRFAWPVDSALVQADALAPDGGGTSVARAVRTVAWKNWVGAWLEFFADVLRDGAKLAERLAAASEGERGAALVGDLLFEARRFVANQPGRAAEWLGKREIDLAMRDFVSGDIDRLDPAGQAAVLTQLEVAAGEVRPTTLGNYTLVTKANATLADRITSIEEVGVVNAANLENIRADINAKAATVDEQARNVAALAESVQRDRLAVDQQMTRFDTRAGEIDTRLDQFDTRFAQFNTQVTQFDSRLNQFNTQITQFDTRFKDFNTQVEQFDTRFKQFNTQLAQFDTRLNQFNTQVAQVDTRLNQFNTQITQFDTRFNQFNTQFGQFSTSLTRFNSDLATFNTNRTALVGRIDRMQTDLQTVRVDVNTLSRPRGGGG